MTEAEHRHEGTVHRTDNKGHKTTLTLRLLLQNEAEALTLSAPNSVASPNTKPPRQERLEEPAPS
jgi:hypothetical protein